MNLAGFCACVIYMTAVSLWRSGAQPVKERFMAGLLALGVNFCACWLICSIWTGNWNLWESFSQGTFWDLSYQQLFDLALVLLAMYAGAVLSGSVFRILQRSRQMPGKSRNLVFLLLSSCLFLLTAVFLFMGIQGQTHIMISEFYLPDKKTTLEGLDAYIEITNHGSFPYETADLYLSDDRNNLQKVQISSGKLPADSAVTVPVDDNVFAFGQNGGDTLILSNQNGEILDEVITGDTRKDKAYARSCKDQTWEYRTPSPDMYNPEKPEFSVAPGFYSEAFYVELSAPEDADIYYTWDGSTPTVQSEKYSEKILIYDRSEEENTYRSIPNVTRNWMEREVDPTPVPKATVIRAIAVNANGAVSEIATATYFVNQDGFSEQYVVSLVADPQELFGPQGIYSTGEAYDQWYLNGQVGTEPRPNFEIRGLECSGSFELFYGASRNYLGQPCGIRIQGGSHRTGDMKRLSVFSREEYSGSKFFDRTIFGDRRSHSVVLREGFENTVTMEMVPDRSLTTQESIPVAMFLNGEFWYYTYLQEKYSDEYFEEYYQLSDVEFLKAGVTEQMLAFVKENDMRTEDAYQRLNELADIQSYIDFMCANVYLANTDYAEATSGGNSAMWRSRKVENQSYGDGRWRWALFDMDLVTAYCRGELGLKDITDAQLNTFVDVRAWTKPLDERPFYSALKQNPQFRQQFVLSFMDMANTCFAPDAVEPILNKWGASLEYNKSFFLERKQYITQYLADSYDLTGTQEELMLQISDPAAGWIQVNTCQPNLSEGIWSGTYFTDYPVTVTAAANDGYRFVRWEGDICTESPVISFYLPEGGVSVRGVYEACGN